MRRLAYPSLCGALVLASVAALVATPRTIVAQLPDTLPRYRDVNVRSDSAAIVQAANDALQGLSSVEVPMRTTYFHREKQAVMVSLEPIPTPGVVWRHLGGTVRILEDGRRIIVARQ